MKRFSTFLFFQIFVITSFCQKTEFNFNVYSGFFSYKGNGSASSSTINYGIYIPTSYTTNVYGNRSGFSISFETQVIKNTRSNFLYGSGVSYDVLTSNIKIDKAKYSPEVVFITQSYIYDAKGNTDLKNVYVNINPFFGKRILKNKMIFDLLGGFDLGICLTSTEKGHAIVSPANEKILSNVNKPYPSIDLRPRIQLKTSCKRTGIMLGYSLGLTNYQSRMASKAYSSFLRIGVSYRIR